MFRLSSAAMPEAEPPRPLPHAHTQRAPIARAYGGKQAHAKAYALGHTQLDYGDWITARTPAFRGMSLKSQCAAYLCESGRSALLPILDIG